MGCVTSAFNPILFYNQEFMTRKQRKLSAAQKKAKQERQKKFRWIFINGKEVRVKREPEIDGIPVDDWLLQNADPIWLHQNEMWE